MKFEKLSWMFDTKKVETRNWGRMGVVIIQKRKEARTLYKRVAEVADDVIVELGRKYGGSAVVMAASIHRQRGKGHIYSIDLTEDHFKLAEDFIAAMDFSKYVTMIKANTQQVPGGYKLDDIGLVFFDASHDYDGLNLELSAWYPHIKSGGYLVIHDYGMDKHKGITRAVDEFIAKNNLSIGQVERTVIIRKP